MRRKIFAQRVYPATGGRGSGGGGGGCSSSERARARSSRVGTNVSTYMTFHPLFSLPCLYYPLLFHIVDCLRVTLSSLLALAFQVSNSLADTRAQLAAPRRSASLLTAGRPFVALLSFAFPLSFSLVHSLPLSLSLSYSYIRTYTHALSLHSSFLFRDIGTHSTGFRQARMPLSALTVPLGSSPSESRMEDPWRARFQPRLPRINA